MLRLDRRRSARTITVAALAAACAVAVGVIPFSARAASPSAGERIYRQGLLPSGRPLHEDREGGAGVDGIGAACATCHRRSGLGSWEGQTVVPPIIGRYLFRAGARNVEDPNLPHVQGYVPRRDAYTEATLARAIRDGVDAQGRTLSYLMPRFKLDDAAMAALVAYLKTLTSGAVRRHRRHVALRDHRRARRRSGRARRHAGGALAVLR